MGRAKADGESHSYIGRYLLLEQDAQELMSGELYENLASSLRADATVARHLDVPVGTASRRFIVTTNDAIQELANQLLLSQRSFVFDGRVFAEVYLQFEEYFYTEELTVSFLCPLDNFDMESEEVVLVPGSLKLVKISDQERTELSSPHWYHPRGHQETSVIHGQECFVELIVKTPKVVGQIPFSGELQSSVLKAFDGVCSALRLFQPGRVAYYGYLEREQLPNIFTWNGLSYPISTSLRFPGRPYVMTKASERLFQEFFDTHRDSLRDQKESLAIALRRFNFGYGRDNETDRFIDGMIALEALLFGKNETTELAYKFALRGAALLGDGPDDRRAVYADLKLAYRLRSVVVHGEVESGSSATERKISFSDLAERVEGYLRSALVKRLELGQGVTDDAVVQELDDRLVTGTLAKS